MRNTARTNPKKLQLVALLPVNTSETADDVPSTRPSAILLFDGGEWLCAVHEIDLPSGVR